MALQWLKGHLRALSSSDSIYDVVYLNYLLSKIFGMFIYTVTENGFGKRSMIFTWSDIFPIIRLLCLQATSLYISYAMADHMESTGSNIMDFGLKYNLAIGSFYIFLLAISSYRSFGSFWIMLDKLNQFDEWARQINAPVCHRTQKRRLWKAIVVIILLLTFVVISTGFLVSEMSSGFGMPISMALIFGCFGVPFSLFTHNLSMIGYLVSYRLNHLNATLTAQFVPPKKSSMVLLDELPVPKSNYNKSVVLHQIQLQWTEICQVVELISKTYYRQIIFIATASTIMSTFSVFVFYRAMISQDYSQKLNAIVYLMSNWYVMLLILVMIGVFDGIKQKGKRTAALVHKALRETSNDRIRDELMLFSSFLAHKKIVVNCYIFVCDWTLGMSLISAIISYLVILIQFDASLVTTIPKNDTNSLLTTTVKPKQ
ncbi:AAEL010277-PA, partial [Aedes aegypti]